MKHFYGWRPDTPDQRDLLYCAVPSVPVPADLDLRPEQPPVFDQGQLGSCHDAITEVLTDNGFKLFASLNGSERLATVNPETSQLTFEVPTRIVRFPYSGEMVCGQNSHLDFKVTPDHKMLVRPWDESARALSSSYQLVPAKDIGWYCGLLSKVQWNGESASESYTLPGVAHKHLEQRQPKDVPMAGWLRFLGIYLAEGTMLKRDQQHDGSVSYKIQIAGSKEREKVFIRETLAAVGLHALELEDRFTFENRRAYEALAALGLEGVKAAGKFVPAFVFRQSATMIREFLAGHFAGDGCQTVSSKCHYTGSKRLADDLQTLIFLAGYTSRVTVRTARSSMTADGRSIVGTLDEHRISVCEAQGSSIERKGSIATEPYEGDVFCAEVPTHHTLVTRRNGKILVSGNCTANGIAGELEAQAIMQGLPLSVLSRLFIYYNERVMEHTVTEDSGAEIRDGIKSVATQGVCPESEWPYKIGKFAVKPQKQCYSDALKFRALTYRSVPQVLNTIKSALATARGIVFGISVYESFESDAVAKSGIVPMPAQNEQMLGGHCVRLVGFTDHGYPGIPAGHFIGCNSWGTGWGKCLAGGTEISLLNGQNSTIESLVGTGKVWVYSYDLLRERIVPAEAEAKCTGYRDDFVRVHLDNGAEVLCTSDHLWLGRSGEYIRADALEPGSSLMPLYRKSDHGYERFYAPNRSKWITTHWSVVHQLGIHATSGKHNERYCYGIEECQLVVHHKDFDGRNNTPSNLEPMYGCQHTALHQQLRTPEERRATIDGLWADPERAPSMRANSVKQITAYNEALRRGEVQLTETQIAARRINGVRTGKLPKHPCTDRQRESARITGRLLGKLPKTAGQRESARGLCGVLSHRRWHGNTPISTCAKCTPNNHKITSIDSVRLSLPVYDLVVPEYHNFALAAGAFVHNSGYFALPYAYVTNPNLASDLWVVNAVS